MKADRVSQSARLLSHLAGTVKSLANHDLLPLSHCPAGVDVGRRGSGRCLLHLRAIINDYRMGCMLAKQTQRGETQ
jgi:hypothetical protein